MTSSRAGSPLGKTDFSKASRSIPPRPAPAPRRVPLDARASGPAPTVVRADDEPLVRRLVARADFPATPCARLRCAPSAAARPNVRPHSGQTNSSVAAVAVDLRDVARLPVARLRVARLLLARWVLAVCLFDVDISTSSFVWRRTAAFETAYVVFISSRGRSSNNEPASAHLHSSARAL